VVNNNKIKQTLGRASSRYHSQTQKSDIPFIPLSLLEWLEQAFPDVCPSSDISREEFIKISAEISLVRKLRLLYENQEKKKNNVQS
jgi:hypothetical protein